MKLKGCCAWFEKLMAESGKKGFAILPARLFGRRWFLLQARSVDEEGLQRLMEPPPPGKEPLRVTIAMDLPLRHCPNCTRPCADLIAEQLEEFDRAATEVEKLVAATPQ